MNGTVEHMSFGGGAARAWHCPLYGRTPNDVPNRYFHEAVTLGAPVFVYPPEYLSGRQIRSLNPFVRRALTQPDQ